MSASYLTKHAQAPAIKQQLEIAGSGDDLVTCEAARVLRQAHRDKQARRARKEAKGTPEDLFDHQCRSMRLPAFVRQHLFAKADLGRRWQFDFAFVAQKLAVEIEGLVVMRVNGELVVKGRHASITGFKEDCVKYASAAQLGWTVLRFEQSQVKSREAIEFTIRVLCSRGWSLPC